MKTKSRKRVNNCKDSDQLRPVFDLFGDVAVTQADIYLWCEVIPKIKNDSWRLDFYVKNWDVVNKIKWAKISGRFWELSNDPLS